MQAIATVNSAQANRSGSRQARRSSHRACLTGTASASKPERRPNQREHPQQPFDQFLPGGMLTNLVKMLGPIGPQIPYAKRPQRGRPMAKSTIHADNGP
jgi:hypothetical protein